jgi:hypothetical protein
MFADPEIAVVIVEVRAVIHPTLIMVGIIYPTVPVIMGGHLGVDLGAEMVVPEVVVVQTIMEATEDPVVVDLEAVEALVVVEVLEVEEVEVPVDFLETTQTFLGITYLKNLDSM